MNSIIVNSLCRLVMVAIVFSLSGCYYMQAARGQMEIVRKREPIEEVVAADATSPELGARLLMVADARQFSIDALGLPDNASYRSYAELERDYVVWNIVAVPEFSFQAKTWCYPVVGCVSYRGYFSRDAAQKLADRLREDGYDVAFGGVSAYSTLGKFSDPVLSTMMHWGDTDLVAVMFHELAHQVLYVKDDTGFNESFATAVEEIGIERWLESREQEDELEAWRAGRELNTRFAALVVVARSELGDIFDANSSDEKKRELKKARLDAFAQAAKALFSNANRSAPGWLDSELNNARLVTMTLYHGRLEEFRVLLQDCSDDLPCFYNAARILADSI